MTNPCSSLRNRWTASLAFVLIFTAGAWAAEVAKKNYQLPAGDAVVTLKRFSEQSGEQLVYPVDAVRGVQTNALSGELTARDALGRLVAGTELRVVQDASSGALAVNRAVSSGGVGSIEGRVFNLSNGSYMANARVTIDALRLETFTDDYGFFRFPRVPAGDVVARASYTGFPADARTTQWLQDSKARWTLRCGRRKTWPPTTR